MRFRESPPNSRLTTLYCILHPSNLYFAQSPGPGSGWRDHRLCPSLLLHSVAISTLCPHACLFLLPLSLPLSVVILAWPPGPSTSGQSTCLRRKPSLWATTKVGGLRSCSVVQQPFSTAIPMPSNLLRPRNGRQLRSPVSGFSLRWVMTPPRGRPLSKGSMETAGGACFLAHCRRPTPSLASRKPLAGGLDR